MLIDTHCHLDASEFDADRDQVWREAQAQGVRALVIPAVMQSTFQPVMDWCAQHPHTGFALGWHPLFVDQAADDALQQMQDTVAAVLAGPQAGQLLAIGEIGLDFYVTRDNEAKQVALFEGQLQIAKHNRCTHALPPLPQTCSRFYRLMAARSSRYAPSAE